MSERKSGLTSFVLILCIIGSVLSFWSLEHFVAVKYHADTSASLCNIYSSFNCDAVNQSSWSVFLGFPLAGYGLLFYLSLALYSLFQIFSRTVDERIFGNTLFVLSVCASLLSILLFIISKVDIGALCLYCMGMYVVNFALLLSSFFLSRDKQLAASMRNGFLALFSWPLLGLGIVEANAEGARKKTALKSFLLFLVLAVLCLPFSEPLVHALVMEADTAAPQISNTVEADDESVNDWERQVVAQLSVKGEEAGALARDYTKGDPNAPVQIVEYFDYECPACRNMYFVLKQLLEKYPNQISVTLKNYPLDKSCNPTLPREIHRFACFGSYFTRCAGEQGKFWEAADLVFESEALNSFDNQTDVENALFSEAGSRGIDVAAVKECIRSGRHSTKILEDISSGGALGVQGTPTLWVNGKRVTQLSLPGLEAIINQVLSSSASQKPVPETSSTKSDEYGVATF